MLMVDLKEIEIERKAVDFNIRIDRIHYTYLNTV